MISPEEAKEIVAAGIKAGLIQKPAREISVEEAFQQHNKRVSREWYRAHGVPHVARKRSRTNRAMARHLFGLNRGSGEAAREDSRPTGGGSK